MSKLKEELDKDIRLFFDSTEKQCIDDKIKSLKLLIEKYVHLNSCDFMMDKHDLNDIISSAKSKFATNPFPIFLGESRFKVDQVDQANFCVIESVIEHLNKNNCLKKLPRFDKRQDKF